MPEEKKTIVIFSCFYEPFMSGAERFVKETVERLKGSRSFVVITAKLRPDLPAEKDFPGYKVVRVGCGDRWDKIRYIWLAPHAAKKYNPQMIHAVMESYAGLALWRAKKILPGAKRILTLQSGDLDKKIWSKIPYLWKKIHTSPDYVTAISNFLAARAKRLGAKNVQVIPNGVDFAQFAMVSPPIIPRYKIVCIGRLSWEKGHKYLIDALPAILCKYPGAELILVGDGPLRRKIEMQISNLKLQNKIKLLGSLPHDKALDELGKADVFICPSLAEGLGIVFIEAQAIGVPTIGTNVGGIPDVIQDGETGFLIKPEDSQAIADAIIKVFELDYDNKLQLADRARQRAGTEFNWDAIADQIEQLYQKIKEKILICTGIYPPDIGGPATYTKLIQEELLKRGYEVSVLSYGEDEKIFNVSRKHNILFRYFFYFLRVLKLGKNADVIYVQDPVSVGLPATLANIFLKKKVVLKVVGDYAWEQAQQIPNPKSKISNLDNFYPLDKNYPVKIKLLQKIQTWAAKRADEIITPSFYLKNILIDGWKINPEKIKVIYNSFDVPAVIAKSEARRQSQPFKLLSVGRLVPWKGFDTLIEIIKDMPGVELEIVGDGPEYKNYELRITNYELKDKIKLLGRLLHADVIQKMRSSDLFILNSGYEGLSHVILETMAVGLPVSVSRAGGNTELVGENEERGHLFNYNNKEQIKEKINYIMAHPEETQEKAKKAREFVASFSKDRMIEKLEKELE